MSTVRYRAAVIGCGKMSRGHANAYAESPNVDLIAGADVFESARTAFATEYNLTAMYEDATEMLEKEKPDFVSICTWPPLHADLTELAFSKGVKVVWCEKPTAVDLQDVDRMVASASAANALLIINHQRRYGEAYMEARRLIDTGAIGKLTQITGICGGDTLTDGTHLIDMVRNLNSDNPVSSVFGAIEMSPMGSINPDGMGTVEFNQTRKRYGHHIESGTLALLRFENGVRGHLEIGNLARGGYQRFIVDGTEGRIELSGDQPFDDGSSLRLHRFGEASKAYPPMTVQNAMHGVLADFIKSVETGYVHPMRGESARNVHEIISAIYESARRRQIVTLPADIPLSPLEEMIATGEIPLN